jgi:uncharacterized membrane protein YedE/YeeE
MKPLGTAFLSGLLFSGGLGLAGMTIPNNVIGFLDIMGTWKPALAFVMLGGIVVYAISFRLIIRRPKPIFGSEFHMPQTGSINSQLIIGSAIFGIGWGTAGFCPGPAFTAVGAGSVDAAIFTFFMLTSMALYASYEARPK